MDNRVLGKRIAKYRSRAQISQEELAQAIGISRTAYTQIELGKRNLSAIEFSRIAEVLNFSMDEIMSSDYSYQMNIFKPLKLEDPHIRISVPKFNIEKFQNLILYILEKCAGKPNMGETVLYKLLYFSDFDYYELYEEHLSGAKYRKWAKGPVPCDIAAILHEMEAANMLQSFTAEYYGYRQKRYIPLISSDKRLFNGAEIDVIDKVIERLSDMSARQISEYSHGDMPWKASKDRQDIDYELVFYREAPYSIRTYNEDCDD